MAIRNLHGTINILNHENRPIGGGQHNPPQVGVAVNTRQLQIIDVELEVISHGRNQARVTRTCPSRQRWRS
jgi:hypothetical protein